MTKKRPYNVVCDVDGWVGGRDTVFKDHAGDETDHHGLEFWVRAKSDVEAAKLIAKQALVDARNPKAKVTIRHIEAYWKPEKWEKFSKVFSKKSRQRQDEGEPPKIEGRGE